ncbi:MAG: response regulator transcription factor [Cyclobacteriaceae bacterium]|nr:response regulator transcription factor [Cyclobacteriaceae bacterium]
MKRINILLVDDEVLIRQGVRALLEKEDFVDEIYEAGNAAEFYEVVNSRLLDIILLDVRLPGVKGPDLLGSVINRPMPPRVIAVTGMEGVELVINLLKAGVSGIVFKLDGYAEISRAIHEVMTAGHYFQDKVTRIIEMNAYRWDHVPPVSLSTQESELIQVISSGLTTKEVAQKMKMSEATTETYRTRLLKKLGVPNTAALLAYAYRNGIL